MLAYTLSVADRTVLGIIQEPIKQEFSLTDFQLGLLGGPAFALLYTLFSIPVARRADLGNRKIILAICVGMWSLMTAACGMATNLVSLFIARMGVSIGEAGCNPTANSLIADYFPPERRATATSTYVLGVALGGLLAAFAGGWLTSFAGWRSAFFTLGISGILLAALIAATLREPVRNMPAIERASLAGAAYYLVRKPAFVHVAIGSALAGFVGYGVNHYLTSFLVRSHSLSLMEGAGLVGVILGICGGVGAFGSGFISDRLSDRFPSALTLVPAFGQIVATPLYLTAFLSDDLSVAMIALMVGAAAHTLYMAATYAVSQGVATPRMRATAVALMLVVINFIGFALGPPAVGWLSDSLANQQLTLRALSSHICAGSSDSVCAQASEEGLRKAMMIAALAQLWAALHFLLASRSLRKDWVG